MGKDRAAFSTIMETTSADYEDQKFIRMLRLSNLRNDVEGIMGDMFAIGTKAEEVDKSLAIVESMKQELQDRLDECKAMKVNGVHGNAWAEKSNEEPQVGVADIVEILPPPLLKLLQYLLYRNPNWDKPYKPKWRVKKYKKSRDRTLAEQIQNWAVRKPVPIGGQMVTPIQDKETENRALAWAYYWGKSLPAAVSEFDYVEQGGSELLRKSRRRTSWATVPSSTP